VIHEIAAADCDRAEPPLGARLGFSASPIERAPHRPIQLYRRVCDLDEGRRTAGMPPWRIGCGARSGPGDQPDDSIT
jgi:hypothetical protein